jgi:hypothetical protein
LAKAGAYGLEQLYGSRRKFGKIRGVRGALGCPACLSKPGSTEARARYDTFTLVIRDPFPPRRRCTHWVKRRLASDGLLTCGGFTEFIDASVDPG